jgi:hypothetical protein
MHILVLNITIKIFSPCNLNVIGICPVVDVYNKNNYDLVNNKI